jgi:uncharacterized protein
MRHWKSIVCILEKGQIFGPLLFQDEEGTAHGNDWAHGFMRGVSFHHESWKELINDEEHGGPLIPIMILAHEHDPDPEMRPRQYRCRTSREKLILGISGAVTAILPLLCATTSKYRSGTRWSRNGKYSIR